MIDKDSQGWGLNGQKCSCKHDMISLEIEYAENSS